MMPWPSSPPLEKPLSVVGSPCQRRSGEMMRAASDALAFMMKVASNALDFMMMITSNALAFMMMIAGNNHVLMMMIAMASTPQVDDPATEVCDRIILFIAHDFGVWHLHMHFLLR